MAKGTKERILAAALELFSQNGYAGTNIRELSASLGLVKSAMYKHFESKEEIWNYEVQEYINRHYYNLKFSAAIKTDVKDVKKNPKRAQRDAKKQTLENGIGRKYNN